MRESVLKCPAGHLLAQGYGWRAGRCWVGRASGREDRGVWASSEVPGRVEQPGRACQFPGWKVEPWTTLPGCTRHRNVLDSRPLGVSSWTCCQLRKQLLYRVIAQNALFGKEGRLR